MNLATLDSMAQFLPPNFELRLGWTTSEFMVTELIHTIFYVMLIASTYLGKLCCSEYLSVTFVRFKSEVNNEIPIFMIIMIYIISLK